MSTKTASLSRRVDADRWAAPADKPRLAFARDDTAGADKAPAAAPRILVVEDDFLVAADIEAALLDAGFDVVGVADSGEAAIELAAAHKPVLIVMDIRLAGARDGIETAIEIHRQHGIRCLFASAHSDDVARNRAKSAEPLGWLQKPYSMGRLVDAVREALSDLSKAP